MLTLFFVGDGERDRRTVPHLVRSIIGPRPAGAPDYQIQFSAWKDPHIRATGYTQKLNFIIKRAIDASANGIVATVDCDAAERGSRLAELKEGRDRALTKNRHIAVAVGEANPHGEAWLIGDPNAVRSACKLKSNITIAADSKNPKADLDQLIRQSEVFTENGTLDAFEPIAKLVNPKTVEELPSNGFKAFAAEVRERIGPVINN